MYADIMITLWVIRGCREPFKQTVTIIAKFEEKIFQLGQILHKGANKFSILTNIPIMGRSIMTNFKNLWT